MGRSDNIRSATVTAAPVLVTSLQNDRIKAIRALEMRKARKETGQFVVEGAALIVTAREHGHIPKTLVFQTGTADRGVALGLVQWVLAGGTEVLEVSEAVLGKLAAKDNPQSMLAVFEQRWAQPPTKAPEPASVWVALEEVRDPGNLGTIVRTIDAVGAAGLMLIGTCCDPFSRESVRATMGSIFSVPIVKLDREAFLGWRAGWPGDVVGTHLAATDDFRTVPYRRPVVLVMGGEGPGLSQELAGACDRLVKIPMAGRLDSLNLAIATALALYQIRAPFLRV
jgi:TrmH family RNA methyltransferase